MARNNSPIRTRPWKRPPWKRRRGVWWAPVAEDTANDGTNPGTTALDSCFTPFTATIPSVTDSPSILIIPILFNLSQGIGDQMVDKLDTAFADNFPGGTFDGFREKPTEERWRVERISGSFTMEMTTQDNSVVGFTLVHMGIIVCPVIEDDIVVPNPQDNSDCLRRWLWMDHIPISSIGAPDAVIGSGFLASGQPGIVHRHINLKRLKLAVRPETALALVAQLDTPQENGIRVDIAPMLRAFVTRST